MQVGVSTSTRSAIKDLHYIERGEYSHREYYGNCQNVAVLKNRVE